MVTHPKMTKYTSVKTWIKF